MAVTALAAAYHIPGRGRRSALITQRIDLSGLGIPTINPDVTGKEFDSGWRKLPILYRLAAMAVAPPASAPLG